MSDVIHLVARYPGLSRDYQRLVELMKRVSVICLVDYARASPGGPVRDVGHTLYGAQGLWEICSRGMGYVHGFTEAEFIQGCEEYHVEFLDPEANAVRPPCLWKRWATGQFQTSCDNVFEFTNDGIPENGFKVCPYCGGKIEERKKPEDEAYLERRGKC